MNGAHAAAHVAHASGAGMNTLLARRIGIDTRDESVVFMRKDCHVCRAEGFTAHARVRLEHDGKAIIATVNHVTTGLIAPGEAGLSESLWERLGASEGNAIRISHASPLNSLGLVRGRIYGKALADTDFREIITDIVAGQYSDIHIASFVTACSARPLDRAEVISLTRAMVAAGERLQWPQAPIVDKHCVGGLPGNRTTPIVVAIAAARGLTMPKTSSRAITSPAGTTDTMETLAPVDLDLAQMRRVVDREGGCIVWGGAVRLSPADDLLIRVERALDIDSEGQLVASVLSKKIAAGATDLVIDVPVGPTAKVRSSDAAGALSESLIEVGRAFGLKVRCVATDGTQPVGRGIGPALEARDVLAVLQNASHAPADLRARALALAGVVLELGGAAPEGGGRGLAASTLAEGRAWAKFQRICDAQGGMRSPPRAPHLKPIVSRRPGRVVSIDNRRLAKVAKLAGAPEAKAAGVELHVHVGDEPASGQPLYTLHAETPGELAYALEYADANPDIILVSGA
jgi:thymidine phosphorylase